MENISEKGKKFDLSQNSFVIFMFGYAPWMILGTVVLYKLHDFMPDLLDKILWVILFVGSIVKGIMDLQLNKRTLIISDDAIMVYLKKRKNSILLTKINNEEIVSIKQFKNEAFTIVKKDGQEEMISVSCMLKPYNITLYSIKEELFKIYGKERTDFEMDDMLIKYVNMNAMPKELLSSDNSSKIQRLLLVIAFVIFGGIPTTIGILSTLSIILHIISGLLNILIAILTSFMS